MLPIWSSGIELEKSGIIVKANVFYRDTDENYFGTVSHYYTSENGIEMKLPLECRSGKEAMIAIIEQYLNRFTDEFGIEENIHFKEKLRV